MSNLTKLEFVALDISDNNYLSLILDVEIHLDASNLEKPSKKIIVHPYRIALKL